ncbi:MAG: sulfatase-like hydrolase/transferase, partial [Thermoanaerobaculia bacterium]
MSIDTLRSDRLPAYGYGGVETPHLDELRRDSILFERAYSHVPLTLPAHASLLTGLLPPEHGVRDNLGYRLDGPARPNLPRQLREAGYATGAAISAYVLRSSTGIAEGFDWYGDDIELASETSLGRLQRPGRETLARALEWIETLRDRPFFLLLHLYEPHSPYTPPQPFASKYSDKYDGEIAESDRLLGELIVDLERRALYDEALILVLSDHGEGLGDHGQDEHEVLIYRENLQIPMIVKLPGNRRAGDTVRRPVQLIDVYPTVTEVLDLSRPSSGSGLSMLADGDGDRSLYAETLYPRLHYGWADLASLIRGPYHYIRAPRPELYNLIEDPGETRDIAATERRVFAELRRELEGLGFSFQPAGAADDEERRKLTALGYFGSAGDEADDDGPRPDPKDRIQVVRDMGLAFGAFFAHDYERAIQAFRVTLAAEPRLVDAWEHLGKSLGHLGRHAEAEQAFKRALELSSGAPHIALAAAETYVKLGRLDDAKTHAQLALDRHDVAVDLLAQIAIRQERLDEAEALLEKALENRGNRLTPLVLLANLRVEQGRFDEAVEITQNAEAEHGGGDPGLLRGLFFQRGSAYARLGEAEEAERAFRREIELSPDEIAPYTHLAYL